jgi:hypothetical protein
MHGVAVDVMMLAKSSASSRYYWDGKSKRMAVKGREIRNMGR